MNRTQDSSGKSRRMVALAVSTAMAAGLLTGCAAQSAPRADVSASRAEASLAKGKPQQAVEHAEAAVLAEPQNASYRAMLASAYLDAGRFASAESTFRDAMKLGDNSTKTALSLALALDGQAKYQQADTLLRDWEDQIAPADLGLAYALSGDAGRGIQVMSNAIRGGENTAKMRQNLAYAYALAGRWQEARLMAAQDVPANQVGDRMEEWAEMAQPQAWQTRVAALLGAPAGVVDAGQPAHLALVNNPSVQQLAAEARGLAAPSTELAAVDSPAPAAVAHSAPDQELPPVPKVAPQAAIASAPATKPADSRDFNSAFAAITPVGHAIAQVAQDTLRFVSQPVVQTTPARQERAPRSARAPSSTPLHVAAADRSSGTHFVQLGSFASEQGARRAWDIYAKRYPELSDHSMLITRAIVGGKHYWRVSAAGFGLASSQAMCGRVKNAGGACFAYAQGRPLPGAIDSGTRLALR